VLEALKSDRTAAVTAANKCAASGLMTVAWSDSEARHKALR